MITTLNGINADIQARYLKLFNEASDVLTAEGLLNPIYSLAPNFDPDSFISGTYYIKGAGDNEYILVNTYAEAEGKELYIKSSSISTLEEYFCNIKNLYEKGSHSKFLMLPLNEDFFEINANTRTITVPNAFKKGVGVAGDVIAETLLFRVDRFFDITDLYTTDIYVQWEGADKQQYVSIIDMVDAETYADEGKIVFGWPLTDKLTAAAGTIKFAVRFIKEETPESGKIVYSLGTLPATATISPSLAFNIFEAKRDDGANDLFASAIENSENTVGPQAKAPVFINDLPDVAYMTVDESGNAVYAIRTTTSIADFGNVTYRWYHKADADSRRVFLASDDGKSNTDFGVNFNVASVFEKTADTVMDSSKVYYIQEGVGYVRNDDAEADMANLFERYSVLTISGNEASIPEDGLSPVTGYYYVEATNRLNGREKTTKSPSVEMPMPEVPVIAAGGDLPAAVTLEDGATRLEFKTEVAAPAVKNYTWYYSADKEEWELRESQNSSVLLPGTIGYYKAEASATANLGRKKVESSVCKVVDEPVAPMFADTDAEGAVDESISLTLNTEIIPEMASVPTGELYSDSVSYYWEADASTDKDPGTWNALTNEEPTARLDLIKYGISGTTVRCVAVNKLNNRTAESRSKTYILY